MAWKDKPLLSWIAIYDHLKSDCGSTGLYRWFHRGLGVIYLTALAPLFHQVSVLIGAQGLTPAKGLLDTSYANQGVFRSVLQFPSLFHLWTDDSMLYALVASGCIGAILLIAGRHVFLGAVIAWMSFLSLTTIGGDFFVIIIDLLLSEVGFLAMFSAWFLQYRGQNPRVVDLAFRLLNFRLWFCMGVNKFYMPMDVWTDFTFFDYFFQAQPMPTPLAWYLDKVPISLKHLAQVCLFIGEIIIPFFVFGGGLMRWLSVITFVTISVLIQLSGNYGYFNLLSIVLALVILKDADLPFGLSLKSHPNRSIAIPLVVWPLLVANLFLQVVYCATVFDRTPYSYQNHFNHTFLNWRPDNRMLDNALEALRMPSYWRISSPYGVFKGIPKYHAEIRFSGSLDGRVWEDYQFRYLPSAGTGYLGFYAPYYPRLDHVMFYEGLCEGAYRHNPLNPYSKAWQCRFVNSLFEPSTELCRLLLLCPLGKKAPEFIKAELLRLRFSTNGRAGDWWLEEHMGHVTIFRKNEGVSECDCLFDHEATLETVIGDRLVVK